MCLSSVNSGSSGSGVSSDSRQQHCICDHPRSPQAHSVDLADLEDGDLDNEGEGPICHPMAVKDLQNILCDSVFFVQHQEADQDDDDGMVWIPVRKRSLGAWLVTRKVGKL